MAASRVWPGVALLLAMSLAGCSTSALRGVGAPEPQAVSATPAPEQLAAPLADAAAQAEPGVQPAALAAEPEPAVQPVALASEPLPPVPEMGSSREEAVGQIRSKAGAPGSGKPNPFASVVAPADRMTAEEQARMRAELAEAAARNQSSLTSTEAERKAAEARRLKEKARSHYDQALKEIEN